MLREDVVPADPIGRLSPRELEVLAMTANGMTNTQIGGRLGVTVHAVKFHLGSIYRKLGVANRTEAAAIFIRSGGGEGTRAPGAAA